MVDYDGTGIVPFIIHGYNTTIVDLYTEMGNFKIHGELCQVESTIEEVWNATQIQI